MRVGAMHEDTRQMVVRVRGVLSGVRVQQCLAQMKRNECGSQTREGNYSCPTATAPAAAFTLPASPSTSITALSITILLCVTIGVRRLRTGVCWLRRRRLPLWHSCLHGGRRRQHQGRFHPCAHNRYVCCLHLPSAPEPPQRILDPKK